MPRSAAKKQPQVYPPGESPQERLDAEARRTYGMSAEEFHSALADGAFAEQYDNHDPDFWQVFELMGPYLDATMHTRIRPISAKEARQEFEETAQRSLGMTGEEFVRKWEAGEFGDPDDHPQRSHLWELVWSLPWYYRWEQRKRKHHAKPD